MASRNKEDKQESKGQRSRPRFTAPEPKFATVAVGAAKKRFVVHEHLLTHYSGFFRAALTGGFKESKDKTVELVDTDPIVFELFVHWLYYQRFPSRSFGDDKSLLADWEHEEDCIADPSWFIKLYIFGDKYKAEHLSTDALNGFFYLLEFEKESTLPNVNDIHLAFNHLPSDSPMCRFLAEAYSYWVDPATSDKFNEIRCVPFLRAVWRRMYQLCQARLRPGIDYRIDICDFHKHSTEEEKATCKKKQECRRCKLNNELKKT